MTPFILETSGGNYFDNVAKEAKKLADVYEMVQFEFNGIQCMVNKDTIIEFLIRDYHNAHIMDWETIGPECAIEYDLDTQILLYGRRLVQAKKRKKAIEKMAAKDAKERKEMEDKIKNVSLLIRPEEAEDYEKFVELNSRDGYSRAVVDYAETWAKLMQIEMAAGNTEIALIADECQKDLGYLGITGFQYGCAVNILSTYWVFGEELRRRHNKSYGISEDKKGVVNPAVITIGTK